MIDSCNKLSKGLDFIVTQKILTLEEDTICYSQDSDIVEGHNGAFYTFA